MANESKLLNSCSIFPDGIFQGWTNLVWTATIAAALGGIVVSAVMKYADNVRKTYCQTLAIGERPNSLNMGYWEKNSN